jgi:hypothetical protein
MPLVLPWQTPGVYPFVIHSASQEIQLSHRSNFPGLRHGTLIALTKSSQYLG